MDNPAAIEDGIVRAFITLTDMGLIPTFNSNAVNDALSQEAKELREKLDQALNTIDKVRAALTARYHRPLHQNDHQLLMELDVLLAEPPGVK